MGRKIYVNYVRLKREKEPRLNVSTRKSDADDYKSMYEEADEKKPGSVTENKIRTVVF